MAQGLCIRNALWSMVTSQRESNQTASARPPVVVFFLPSKGGRFYPLKAINKRLSANANLGSIQWQTNIGERERSGLLLLDGGFALVHDLYRDSATSRRETWWRDVGLYKHWAWPASFRILYRNVWIHFEIFICCAFSSSIIGISSENFIFYALVCYIAPRFHKFQFFNPTSVAATAAVWYVCPSQVRV